MKVNPTKTKLLVSGTEGEIRKSKIDPCGVCSKRVVANAMLCVKCKKWVHSQCARVKRAATSLAKEFVCKKCSNFSGGAVEPVELLSGEVETVKRFCYLGNRINASGGCEAAVTSRVRMGWLKFRECGELLKGKRFSLKIKEKVYKSCVRSTMLYGSETWCLRECELAVLRRTERAMAREMCGVKLKDRCNSDELMAMLGLKERVELLARANGVRWLGHVMRRDEDHILRKALEFEVSGHRKRGRPKRTWIKQVEEDAKKVGMNIKDARNRRRWRNGVKAIAEEIWPPS